MGQTLNQLNAQIAKLQKAADALKAQETATVIASLREQIALHGLTADDLFPAQPASRVFRRKGVASPMAAPEKAVKAVKKATEKAAAPKKTAEKAVASKKPVEKKVAAKPAVEAKAVAKPAVAKKAAPKAEPVIKFRDEAGNSWTGHGKRPNWYKDAIAAGKTAADLAA